MASSRCGIHSVLISVGTALGGPRLLAADQQHRGARNPHDALGHTAHQRTLEAAPAVCADDNQRGTPFLGLSDDLIRDSPYCSTSSRLVSALTPALFARCAARLRSFSPAARTEASYSLSSYGVSI